MVQEREIVFRDQNFSRLSASIFVPWKQIFELKEYLPYFRVNYDVVRNTLRFCEVQSQGRKLGFLGFMLDVDSGYLQLSSAKEDTFYPFFSLKKFLMDQGVPYHPEVVTYALERYKLGKTTLEEFIIDLRDNTPQQNSSAVRRFLVQRIPDKDTAVSTVAEELDTFYKRIMFRTSQMSHMGSVYLFFHYSKSISFFDSLQYLRGNALYEDFIDFFNAYRGFMGLLRTLEFSNYSLWEASAIPALGTHATYKHLVSERRTKATMITFQLWDMLESVEKDVAMEFIFQHPDFVSQFLDRVGVGNILSKREMVSLKRGFRRDDVVKPLAKDPYTCLGHGDPDVRSRHLISLGKGMGRIRGVMNRG